MKNDEALKAIQKKGLKHTPKLVWAIIGTLLAFTGFFLLNGIHLGSLASRFVELSILERTLTIKRNSSPEILRRIELLEKSNLELKKLAHKAHK